MSISGNDGGVWKTASDLFVKSAGVWVPVQQGLVRDDGVWKEFYAAEVVATLTSSLNVDLSTLFSGADWASTKAKRIIIPSSVTIGSNSAGTSALRTGTGWGGNLILENDGNITGAGGTPGSGVGGDALFAEVAGLTLTNTGSIRAGGGGGGQGGTGGQGSYSSYVYGAFGRWGGHYWYDGGSTEYIVKSGALLTYVNAGVTYYDYGGVRYERGPNGDGATQFEFREGVLTTSYTSGGAGGAGGRGQGYDGANVSGSGGSAGGTSAGAGGTGGTGATYGATGNTGNTGTNGNYTNGVAGAAGGLAGYGLKNPGNITLTNTGTLLGR